MYDASLLSVGKLSYDLKIQPSSPCARHKHDFPLVGARGAVGSPLSKGKQGRVHAFVLLICVNSTESCLLDTHLDLLFLLLVLLQSGGSSTGSLLVKAPATLSLQRAQGGQRRPLIRPSRVIIVAVRVASLFTTLMRPLIAFVSLAEGKTLIADIAARLRPRGSDRGLLLSRDLLVQAVTSLHACLLLRSHCETFSGML